MARTWFVVGGCAVIALNLWIINNAGNQIKAQAPLVQPAASNAAETPASIADVRQSLGASPSIEAPEGYPNGSMGMSFPPIDAEEIQENEISFYQQLENERITRAKRDVVDAQHDLNRSVRRLANGEWDQDLPTVQKRLRNLENATADLSAVDSAAAADMEWEVGRMKREVRRLETENWRDVVPDVERRNRSLNWESDDLESSSEE